LAPAQTFLERFPHRGLHVYCCAGEQRNDLDEKRARELTLAKLMRPQQVEKFAQDRLTLRKIQNHQIIQLSGGSATPLSGTSVGDKDL
jgi:hypothetical protein